jgi:CheY-like chemotaxis protein
MDPFILSIEDNADDIFLLGMAFRKAQVSARMEFLQDGEQALDYFSAPAAKPIPALLLLDLKLPKHSGLEVLAWMRGHPPLRRLPIVMLTSSNQPEDIDQAYDLGANSYLVKPGSIDELVELARAIESYWLRANAKPTFPPISARTTASGTRPAIITPAFTRTQPPLA